MTSRRSGKAAEDSSGVPINISYWVEVKNMRGIVISDQEKCPYSFRFKRRAASIAKNIIPKIANESARVFQ